MAKEFPYKTVFSSKITPVVSPEKDKYLSKASLEQIKAFIPEIDVEKDIDLLPIAFPAFNIAVVNKNDDCVNNETAVKAYKSFINRPLNLNHKKSAILGVTISSNLTEYVTNKILNEEQVLGSTAPNNVTMGAVIWKTVNPDLAEKIEECNEIGSDFYGKIFASFELGFTDYDIIKMSGASRNLEDGEIISDETEKEKLKPLLRSNGGKGQLDNNIFLYRLLKGDVHGLGMALTENPAAFLEPIAVQTDAEELEDEELEEELSSKKEIKSEEIIVKLDNIDKEFKKSSDNLTEQLNLNKNKISQSENLNVKDNKNICMKLKTKEDVTDESLKEAKASEILDLITSESDKAVKLVMEQLTNKDKEIAASKDASAASLKELEDIKVKFETVSKELNLIKEAATAKESQERHNQRMASFDEEFELDDEDRGVLASDIKDLNDEAFAAYKKKVNVFLKNKKKGAKKDGKEMPMDKKDMEKDMAAKDCKAEEKTEVKEVLEEAKASGDVPNAQAPTETFADKVKKAFSIENVNLNLTRKNKVKQN